MSLPAELRTEKHTFDPDPFSPGDCSRCGMSSAMGGLHLPDPPAFDTDIPQPEPCPNGCPHYRHAGECTGGYPGGVPCRCGATA